MKHILRLLKWVLKAAIFFTLFTFALNNQQDITVHFFFGNHWQAPQVLVVLTAFAAGVMAGVLGMVPLWWQQRRTAAATQPANNTLPAVTASHSSPVAPAYADGI